LNLKSLLYAAVQRADVLGWSVIPLRGGEDAATGKKPAIPWQSYQYRLPSPEELSRWFGDGHYSAYGVVCGEVSGLVVLDCDDAETEKAFRTAFPHLTETYTVRSGIRGTTHFYYHTPYTVSSCKLRGADLKAEGGYVVGAGSQISSYTWTVLNDQRPRSLARAELDAIIAFLERPTVLVEQYEDAPSIDEGRAIDAADYYQRIVDQTGHRNDSLFRTACALRDRRISQFEAAAQLVELHAQQPPRLGQRQEREQQRRREAERTITSAYSRPARRPRPSDPQTNQLPNTLREWLLKQSGGVAFLRTYEGLLLHGCIGGQIVARQAIFKKLAGLVGEHSIKRALAQTAPGGQRLLACVPVSSAAADPDLFDGEEKTCLVDRTKPPKSKKAAHRPNKYYRLPTIEELCDVFGCAIHGVSDPITQDDLESVKAYRQAMERELIRRQPGQYPQGWLADRLGVTERTIYRYHQEIPINSAPTFIRMQLTLGSYQNWLPAKEVARRAGIDLRGQCLEDKRGYRYPPVAALAEELLQKGNQVWLLRRTFNYYWFGEDQPQEMLQPIPKLKATSTANNDKKILGWFDQIQIVPDNPITIPHRIVQTIHPSTEQKSSGEQFVFGSALTQHALQDHPVKVEKLIQRMYTCYQLTAQPMMLRKARMLVTKYGCRRVEKMFIHTVQLMSKQRLTNPAGFLITALQSNPLKTSN
jgi:hypothetical protein